MYRCTLGVEVKGGGYAASKPIDGSNATKHVPSYLSATSASISAVAFFLPFLLRSQTRNRNRTTASASICQNAEGCSRYVVSCSEDHTHAD